MRRLLTGLSILGTALVVGLLAAPAKAQPSDSGWLQVHLPARCNVEHELRERLTREHSASMFSKVVVAARSSGTGFTVDLETERDGDHFTETLWELNCEELVEWVVSTFRMLQDEQRLLQTEVPPRKVTPRESKLPAETPHQATPPEPDPATPVELEKRPSTLPSTALFVSAAAQASSGLPSGVGLGASASVGAVWQQMRIAVLGVRWQPADLTLNDGEVESLTWNQTDARLNVCWQQKPKTFELRFGACADAGWRWLSVQSPLLAAGVESASSYGLLGASLPVAWTLPAGFSVEATPTALFAPAPPSIQVVPLTPDFEPRRVEFTLGLGVTWQSG